MTTTIRFGVRLAMLLAAISVAALRAPAKEPTPPSSKSIVAALQPFVDTHSLAGAVTVVADKDKILSLDTVGFADIGAKKPMRPDSLFWIASQSKPITAAALMMLVDEGKVKLEDPVEKYLPEFKDVEVEVNKVRQKPKQVITVRHILSHTSGLPFKSAFEQPTLDLYPLKERVESYAKTPLASEPGTKYSYSNAGINTAGRIIEVVSGLSYEDFLDKLFGPLGMKDTTFWPNEEQLTRLAKSYRPSDDKKDLVELNIGQLKYPLNDRKQRTPMPAGGLFSTASDVTHFCQMMLNKGEFNGKRLLSEDAVKQLTTKQTGDAVPTNYGLGFSTGGSFGHGGAMATNMSVDPAKGLITVWMVQHAGYAGDGAKSQGAFKKAAEEQFASPKK